MKKIIISAFSLVLFASCTKDITSLNIDPKNPTTVPSYSLFTQGQLVFSNTLTSTNVNLNIFRLIAQQWQETTYVDESNYDIGVRTIPDNWWNALYATLVNQELAKSAARTDITDAGTLKNDTAIIDIQQVYAWYTLATTYGNIPYSEALQPNTITAPKYDDAATVYSSLITRITADIAALDENSSAWGNADLMYGGDVSKWKKFANSLKLKMGILLADSDPAASEAAVVSALAGGVFESNDDNALLAYQSSTPNTNPVWVDLVQSGRQDFVACTTMLGYLTNNEAVGFWDPRTPYYFTLDANDGYSGGDPGAGSSFSASSWPGGLKRILANDPADIGTLAQPTFPSDLLDYSEVNFYLAEAAARGFAVPLAADVYYNEAITASIEAWGGSAADATAYLLQPSVAYATAAGTWQEKIGNQAYLSFYNRGFEAWTEMRRLDFPNVPAPENPTSEFPVRYTYPVKEENVNQPNYEAASSAIGGDEVKTKLWFDKN
jgi:hypothetical protein